MTYNEYLEHLARAFENAIRDINTYGDEMPYFICLVLSMNPDKDNPVSPVQKLYKEYTGYNVREWSEYGREVLFAVDRELAEDHGVFTVENLQAILNTKECLPNKLRAMWLRTLITNW